MKALLVVCAILLSLACVSFSTEEWSFDTTHTVTMASALLELADCTTGRCCPSLNGVFAKCPHDGGTCCQASGFCCPQGFTCDMVRGQSTCSKEVAVMATPSKNGALMMDGLMGQCQGPQCPHVVPLSNMDGGSQLMVNTPVGTVPTPGHSITETERRPDGTVVTRTIKTVAEGGSSGAGGPSIDLGARKQATITEAAPPAALMAAAPLGMKQAMNAIWKRIPGKRTAKRKYTEAEKKLYHRFQKVKKEDKKLKKQLKKSTKKTTKVLKKGAKAATKKRALSPKDLSFKPSKKAMKKDLKRARDANPVKEPPPPDVPKDKTNPKLFKKPRRQRRRRVRRSLGNSSKYPPKNWKMKKPRMTGAVAGLHKKKDLEVPSPLKGRRRHLSARLSGRRRIKNLPAGEAYVDPNGARKSLNKLWKAPRGCNTCRTKCRQRVRRACRQRRRTCRRWRRARCRRACKLSCAKKIQRKLMKLTNKYMKKNGKAGGGGGAAAATAGSVSPKKLYKMAKKYLGKNGGRQRNNRRRRRRGCGKSCRRRRQRQRKCKPCKGTNCPKDDPCAPKSRVKLNAHTEIVVGKPTCQKLTCVPKCQQQCPRVRRQPCQQKCQHQCSKCA